MIRRRDRRGPGGQRLCDGETVTPSDFPGTAGSLIQSTCWRLATDAFVTKLNAAGTALLYSTYLGGSGNDSATGSPWTRRATPT